MEEELLLLERDEVGQKAAIGRIWFYLTPCCQASVTGVQVTSYNPDGVACRACYQRVDPRLGGAGFLPPVQTNEELWR